MMGRLCLLLQFEQGKASDAILLYYLLPVENGLELLKFCIEKDPFIPVIMMKGLGNEAVAVEAIKNGAKDYLVEFEVTEENLCCMILGAVEKSS